METGHEKEPPAHVQNEPERKVGERLLPRGVAAKFQEIEPELTIDEQREAAFGEGANFVGKKPNDSKLGTSGWRYGGKRGGKK